MSKNKKKNKKIILKEITQGKEEYLEFKKELLDGIVADILSRHDEVLLSVEDEDFKMTKGNLLTTLVYLNPFVENNVEVPKEFIISCRDMSNVANIFDEMIEYFGELNIDIGDALVDSMSEFAIISSKILEVYGVSINLYDLTKLVRNNKELYEILSFDLDKLDKGLKFDEIQDIIQTKHNRLIEILKTEDSCYKNLLLSKCGMNERQLKDTLFCIGFKPSPKGIIINEPINASYIKGQDAFGFLIDAFGGRKALCINYKNTKQSGYFTRKLSMLCCDNVINTDVEDCGSIHHMELFIPDKETLRRIEGRNIIVDGLYEDEYHVVNPSEDEDLIGKTVYMRSPIKCACKTGICKTCYGELWRQNKDITVGILGVLLLTNILTQKNLSAKHLLQANIVKLDWGDDFTNNFMIDKDKIFPANGDIKVIFNKDSLVEDEENDYSDVIYVNNFTVETGDKELIEMKSFPVRLQLSENIANNLSNYFKNEVYTIPASKLDDSEYLFIYQMPNDELSASLNAITNLLDTNSFIKEHNIDETLQRMLELLNESSINVNSVHVEIILKEMCQIIDDDRSYFLEEDDPIYDIRRITEALIQNRSVIKSIMFEDFYRQITSMINTYEKDTDSILDKLVG